MRQQKINSETRSFMYSQPSISAPSYPGTWISDLEYLNIQRFGYPREPESNALQISRDNFHKWLVDIQPKKMQRQLAKEMCLLNN